MSAAEGQISPELAQFIQQEQGKAQIQQMVASVTAVCFDKCISAPGRSLSGREESCLSDCAKRFIETTQLIVQRFQSKAAGAGGVAGGF
ncbi:hypothetical protein WJX72_001120 [[Myrmecia] bisecta]|uniref:Mitochondrial import inner membrane translocase subunit n=1 Tax=[Myrmecia] bisecta TaxID=41462 RepID=A0AAW1PJB5_9CHLO